MRRRDEADGFALAELLSALASAGLVLLVCLFGILSALHAFRIIGEKATADALAETTEQYLNTELRFAVDPDETVRSLSSYTASLGGLTIEGLTFSSAPDGKISIRFSVDGREYACTVAPLNQEYDPTLGWQTQSRRR